MILGMIKILKLMLKTEKNEKIKITTNKVKVSKDIRGIGNRQGRQDAITQRNGGYSRVEDNLDNKPSGKTS